MTNARTITNAWVHRTLPDIFYEEPEPIEDGMQQEMALERLVQLLRQRYRDDPSVFMSGAVFVSYDITNGNRRVAPDLFIAFGVDSEAIRENLPNYWMWEVGKAPDFVMEVASDSTASRDLNEKRELYRSLGIAEYWRFDPKNGERYGHIIAGERLVDGVYESYDVREWTDGSLTCHSDLLNLDFYWEEQRGFDVLDPATGRTIDVLEAERTSRLVAEAQLEAERAARQAAEERVHAKRETVGEERSARQAAEERAEAEQAARLAAEARLQELEAELRRLRDS